MARAEQRPRLLPLLLIIFIIVLDVRTKSFYVELSNQSFRLLLRRIQTTNSLFFPPQTVGDGFPPPPLLREDVYQLAARR